jgi:hypothetical protein
MRFVIAAGSWISPEENAADIVSFKVAPSILIFIKVSSITPRDASARNAEITTNTNLKSARSLPRKKPNKAPKAMPSNVRPKTANVIMPIKSPL